MNFPPAVWSEQAERLVLSAAARLRKSPREMLWLQHERCLTEETIVDSFLGFVPGDYKEWFNYNGLLHQAGILIPWFVNGTVTAVNVRRFLPRVYRDENKYRQVRGSFKGLYGVDEIVFDERPLVFVEGEFDRLVLNQFVKDLASVLTMGGCQDHLYPLFRSLLENRKVVALHDNDEAGDHMVEELQKVKPSVLPLTVPVGKDVTEYVCQLPGSLEDKAAQVRTWFTKAVVGA